MPLLKKGKKCQSNQDCRTKCCNNNKCSKGSICKSDLKLSENDICKLDPNNCITIHNLIEIHDDATITIDELPITMLKKSIKGSVFPYSNNKGKRYLVYFTEKQIDEMSDVVKNADVVLSKKKAIELKRAQELVEDNLKKLQKVCTMCNNVMNLDEWNELKCNQCISESADNNILQKALQSKSNLLFKIGKDIGLSDEEIKEIIDKHGLQEAKALDIIIQKGNEISKKRGNAQANWAKLGKLNKQANRLKDINEEIKEKNRITAQYKPCLSTKDIQKWTTARCDDYKNYTNLLSSDLIQQLIKHNQDLELAEQKRQKAIEEANSKYEKCLSHKEAKSWREAKCNDYTQYSDLLKPELIEKLSSHKTELDKIEAKYLADIESLKTKYNKCFKTQNVKEWNDLGCNDHSKHKKELGDLLDDQLRDYKGKLDELEKKRLAIIEKTNKQFAPCLALKDLKSWNESKEKCNDFESFEKNLDKDIYKQLQQYKQKLSETFEKERIELSKILNKMMDDIEVCLNTKNTKLWGEKACGNIKAGQIADLTTKAIKLGIITKSESDNINEQIGALEKHFNELDAHEKKLLLIEQQRLERVKQLATKYNACLKMDYNGWQDSETCKNYSKDNNLKDDPQLLKQLKNVEKALNEVEEQRLQQQQKIANRYTGCLLHSDHTEWNESNCNRYKAESKFLPPDLLKDLEIHDQKLKDLYAKMLAEQEKERKLQEALQAELKRQLEECKKCLSYNEPDIKGYDAKYDGLCKKCEKLEEEGNKIGSKHGSMKKHRQHIQKLITDKETRKRLEAEEAQRKRREAAIEQEKQAAIKLQKEQNEAFKYYELNCKKFLEPSDELLRGKWDPNCDLDSENLKKLHPNKKKILSKTKQDFASRQVAKCQDKYTMLTDEILEEDWDTFCDGIENLTDSQAKSLKDLKSGYMREKDSLKKKKAYESELLKVLSGAQNILDSNLLDKERITQQSDLNKLNELVISLSGMTNIQGVKMTSVLKKRIESVLAEKLESQPKKAKLGGASSSEIVVSPEVLNKINDFFSKNTKKLTKVSAFIQAYHNKVAKCQGMHNFTPNDFMKLAQLEKEYANCEEYELFKGKYTGKRQDLINSAKFAWSKRKGKNLPRDVKDLSAEEIEVFDKYANANIKGDIAKGKAEKEAKEKAEKEAKEKAEKEAKEKAEKEAEIARKKEAERLKLLEKEKQARLAAEKAQIEYLKAVGDCVDLPHLNAWNKKDCNKLMKKQEYPEEYEELEERLQVLKQKAQKTLEQAKAIEAKVSKCNNLENTQKWNLEDCDSTYQQMENVLLDIDKNGENSDYAEYEDKLITGVATMKKTKKNLTEKEKKIEQEQREKAHKKLALNAFTLVDKKYSKCLEDWGVNCDKLDWAVDQKKLKDNHVNDKQISELKTKYDLLVEMKNMNYQYKPCLSVKDTKTWALNQCSAFKKNKNKLPKTVYSSLEKYEKFLEMEEKNDALIEIEKILTRLKKNKCLNANNDGGPTNLQLWQNNGCNAYERVIQMCTDHDIDFKELDKIGSSIGLTNDAHNYLKKQYEDGKLGRIPEKGLYLILALQNRHVHLKELHEKFRSKEVADDERMKQQRILEKQRQQDMETRKKQAQQLKRTKSSPNVGQKKNCKSRFSTVNNVSECCSGKALSNFGSNFECAGGSAKKKKSRKRSRKISYKR